MQLFHATVLAHTGPIIHMCHHGVAAALLLAGGFGAGVLSSISSSEEICETIYDTVTRCHPFIYINLSG